MKWLRYVFAVPLVGVTVWMCFDNVFSDAAPIRALAEKSACTMKKCDEHHGMTREQRVPWGQTIDYSWADGTVHVDCHRAYWAFGERQCTASE
jgi:hypothetical protein